MYSVWVNPPVWWRQHLFGVARLQPPPLWRASKTSFSCPSGAGRMPGERRLTRMFSLPFISCFSHLDSEIPSVFLSVLFPPHRRTYSSHAEKHTKSSNLSSLPLLFCHTRLNCISSAVQPHLRRVRLQRCRQERSIPVPRKKDAASYTVPAKPWRKMNELFWIFTSIMKNLNLYVSCFFLLTRIRPRRRRSQPKCSDQPSLASVERLPRELRRPHRSLDQVTSQSAPNSSVSWRSMKLHGARRSTSSLRSTDRSLKSPNFLQPDGLVIL